MIEQEWIKQAEKDKECAKEQIAFEALLFIFVAFLFGSLVQFVPQFIPQVVFTLFAAGISWTVVKDRVKSSMNTAIDKTEKALKEQYNSGEIQERQLIDFLSIVQDELKLDRVAWTPSLRKESETEEEFKTRVKNTLVEFQNSQEAVTGLLYSYKNENGKDVNLLKAIVITAIEDTLVDKSDPSFKDKFKHLYAYLRAWLLCGIRYNTYNLPIEWIKETTLSKQDQIKSLDHIKNYLVNDEKVIAQIPNKNARKIIEKYLDELIRKLREYQ